MRRVLTCLGLLGLLTATLGLDSPAPHPKVRCELNGQHGPDPDRFDGELALLEAALREAYPRLPEELRQVFRQVTFEVNHRLVPPTKLYMGFSAEDDPAFRENPDARFYPEGAIKVSVTERFIQFLKFAATLEESASEAVEGAREVARRLFAHELRHALQYHTHPVRDLTSDPHACPEGLCSKELIEETKQKIAYEREAIILGESFISERNAEILERNFRGFAKKNPKLFAEGGPYRLLGGDFTDYYLGAVRSRAIKTAQDFVGPLKIVYEGQYVAPEIVLELKELNDRFAEQDFHTYQTRVSQLTARWASYMEAGKVSEKLRVSFAYLAPVAERYQKELERSRALAGGN